MSTSQTANAEAIEAWDGPLFDIFVKYRDVLTAGLGTHGEAALEAFPPQPGQRVLDIGCGFGDTTQRIAGLVGAGGEAIGIDAAPRFIETARSEAAGVANARFEVVDVEYATFTETYDAAFSRMGTMFFNNPVAALRRVREALVPGGRLTMVVWRRREDNEWLYRAQQIVERFATRPDEYEEPTCGPGPFSMANADTTSDILKYAGFADIEMHRCDRPLMAGRDLDEAVELAMSLGPGGEILRLLGDRATHLLADIEVAMREGMAEYVREDGTVWAPASTWIATGVSSA